MKSAIKSGTQFHPTSTVRARSDHFSVSKLPPIVSAMSVSRCAKQEDLGPKCRQTRRGRGAWMQYSFNTKLKEQVHKQHKVTIRQRHREHRGI